MRKGSKAIDVSAQHKQLNPQAYKKQSPPTPQPEPSLPEIQQVQYILQQMPQQQQLADSEPMLDQEEQKKLNNMFHESQLQTYFGQVQATMPFETVELAGVLCEEEAAAKVAREINRGFVRVSDHSSILDSNFLREKISREQEKALILKLKKSQIDQKLKYLQHQTSPHLSQNKSRLNPQFPDQSHPQLNPPNILSKQVHQAFIHKIIKSKQEQDRKHKQYVQRLEASIREEQQKIKALHSDKLAKDKEKRRKDIQVSLEKKRQEHQRIIQEEIKSREEYKKMKGKEFLHEKIQARFRSQVLVPALEEKKKKLKEIRDMSRAFDVKDILQHEKNYVERRNQSFSMAKSQAKPNQDWNYKPPEKKERLKEVLEEEKMEQKKKLEEKKKQIEEKIQRQAQFLESLKEKFAPKIDEIKQRQIEQRKRSINKPRRRQTSIDLKTIGNDYLQHAKKLKKQPSSQTQRQSQQSSSPPHHHHHNHNHNQAQTESTLITNPNTSPTLQQKRRKHLQNLICSTSSSPQQKIRRLQQESDRINVAYYRKHELARVRNQDVDEDDDVVDMLLNGIKAKMGIISLCSQRGVRELY